MDEYRYEMWDAEGNKRDWYCDDVLTGKAPIDRVYGDHLGRWAHPALARQIRGPNQDLVNPRASGLNASEHAGGGRT